MSIKRDDIDTQKVDFTDVASGRRLPPVHRGKILGEEFPTPLRISVYERAKAIKVPGTRANDIVIGRRAVTIEYRASARKVFWCIAGIPDRSADALQSGCRRPYVRRRMEQEISPRAA